MQIDQIGEAFAKLDQAAKLNPNEPYLYLSGSLASLVQGFGMGDWYEVSSFENRTLERALLCRVGSPASPRTQPGSCAFDYTGFTGDERDLEFEFHIIFP
jgi:hypothetical protein